MGKFNAESQTRVNEGNMQYKRSLSHSAFFHKNERMYRAINQEHSVCQQRNMSPCIILKTLIFQSVYHIYTFEREMDF